MLNQTCQLTAGSKPKETIAERKSRLHREWRLRNMDRRRIYNRDWARSHRQSVARTFKKWWSKNSDSVRIKQKVYAAKIRPKKKAYMKVYAAKRYQLKRVEIIAKTKAYAKSHPEVRRKCYKNWIRKNPKKFKANQKAKRSRRRAVERGCGFLSIAANKLIRSWRMEDHFICSYCGVKFKIEDMQVDHIIPICKGGTHTVANICRSCAPCNSKKGGKIL